MLCSPFPTMAMALFWNWNDCHHVLFLPHTSLPYTPLLESAGRWWWWQWQSERKWWCWWCPTLPAQHTSTSHSRQRMEEAATKNDQQEECNGGWWMTGKALLAPAKRKGCVLMTTVWCALRWVEDNGQTKQNNFCLKKRNPPFSPDTWVCVRLVPKDLRHGTIQFHSCTRNHRTTIHKTRLKQIQFHVMVWCPSICKSVECLSAHLSFFS